MTFEAKRMNSTPEKAAVRLNRYLALVGVGSRRFCDDIITSGRVSIDGKKIDNPGVKVIPGENTVSIDGIPVENPQAPTILILNKPPGVVSTVSDPLGRPTVLDLSKKYAKNRRLYPIGRLDVNTTGAILLTNDGLLCYRLTHPRFQVPRTYLARVRGAVTEKKLAKLNKLVGSSRKGDAYKQGRPRAELIKALDRESILRVTLYEGKNRQVRRLCEAVGLRVVKLKRVQFGPVTIRKLPLGAVRPLQQKEIIRLRKIIQ